MIFFSRYINPLSLYLYITGSFQSHQQSTEKKTSSRHFHRSYLKANKVSKSEGTRKVKYNIIFESVLTLSTEKLSKLVHVCQSYSLPKLARFLRHSVNVAGSESFNCLSFFITPDGSTKNSSTKWKIYTNTEEKILNNKIKIKIR